MFRHRQIATNIPESRAPSLHPWKNFESEGGWSSIGAYCAPDRRTVREYQIFVEFQVVLFLVLSEGLWMEESSMLSSAVVSMLNTRVYSLDLGSPREFAGKKCEIGLLTSGKMKQSSGAEVLFTPAESLAPKFHPGGGHLGPGSLVCFFRFSVDPFH